MEIFNQETIVSVQVVDKILESYYKWEVYKPSTFWNNSRKAGFYYEFNDQYTYTFEEINKDGFYILDETEHKIYYRPYVQINFVSGRKKYVYFQTKEECVKYAKEFADKHIVKQVEF
jgi:hypothetical protein